MRRLRNSSLAAALPDIPPKPIGRAPTTGVGTKSHGMADDPIELPKPPDIVQTAESHEQAIEQVEQAVTELDVIAAAAITSGLGLRTCCRLILQEHGPGTKNAAKRGMAYDRRQVWAALKRISAEWEADFKEFAESERTHQIARLRSDLARQRAKANPSFQAIARHEELLGRILGTLKPIKVEVDVLSSLKVSLAAVIVDMSDAEKDAMVREQLELEELAKKARALPAYGAAAE